MRLCKLCDRKHKSLGFCARHYRQLKLGIINEEGEQVREPRRKLGTRCLVEGCDEKPIARDLCTKHYQQWQSGALDESGARLRPVQYKEDQLGRVCKVSNCSEPARSRGFCKRHYALYKNGALDKEGNKLRDLKRVGTWKGHICKIEDCEESTRSMGFCRNHYRQFQAGSIGQHGARLRPENHHPPKNDYKTVQRGYIKKMQKDHPFADSYGYVLEHRLIMEEHIGRYLRPQEVVHHINRVRDDNRLENLQLLQSRKHHPPFHERVEEVEQAIQLLEKLVHKGMTAASEVKERLQCVILRL